MSANIRGNDTSNVNRVGHLAIVTSNDTIASATQTQQSTGATFGAAVQTSNRHTNSVRAIAAAYDTFEDALLPMVLASGVTGDAAVAAADAIMNNPVLRAQAERAYSRARLNAVE